MRTKRPSGRSPGRGSIVPAVLLATLLAAAGAPTPAFAQDGSGPAGPAGSAAERIDADAAPRDFLALLTGAPDAAGDALARIDAAWVPALVPMALETLRFSRTGPGRAALLDVLERRTGQGHDADLDAWWRWWWRQDAPAHPGYAGFKSALYAEIDPVFAGYFDDDPETAIRLDEARWGGVRQDGIPPLRSPSMVGADEAGWLNDTDVVFGIEVNRDARAYPKRILAWHEMFVDTIGGVEIAGVYCTLCGAVIPYETVDATGTRHALGTSGFLYRSNKLMYDRATQSLWSTTRGEPVVGPLVGEGIRLARRPVVTTTWREWRRRHPGTTVLDVDTGHERDYGEGVAYRDYFATERLMFTVPEDDGRLANKAEVLALRFPEDVPGRDDATLAIDAALLAREPVHRGTLAGVAFVVLTDPSGANRVYRDGGVDFASYDGDATVIDAGGNAWTLTEDSLTGPDGRRLERLPANRAFWFGWVAAYPDTRLTS